MTDPVPLSALHPYYKTADGTDRHTRYYDTVFAKILDGQVWQANFVSAFFPSLGCCIVDCISRALSIIS